VKEDTKIVPEDVWINSTIGAMSIFSYMRRDSLFLTKEKSGRHKSFCGVTK